MADLLLQERLQPSLLDRLTDEDPSVKHESRQKRVVTVTKLRELMLRDLSWLFNTTSLGEIEDRDEFPYAAQSVLNYGKPDLVGMHIRGADIERIEDGVRQAILDFEPRILARTLKVNLKFLDDDEGSRVVQFDIEGSLWCQPTPLRLYLRTAVDLETGTMLISDFAC
jgi:type VI secretion system protein ImpF